MEFDRRARTAESHALEAALIGFRSRREWLAAPHGAALAARVAHHLSFVRRFEPRQTAPQRHDWLHLAHWNVLFGTHYDRVLAALGTTPELAGADLISLNETDLGMPRTGNRDVAFDLAQELGLHAAWTALFLEMDGGPRQPPARGVGIPAESLFGLALLSRFPLGELRRVELTSPADLLFDRERRAGGFVALIAEVLRPGAPFHMVVTHLDVHGSPADRARQMREVLAAAGVAAALPGAVRTGE
jgi:endonuclease/exonuclease/phosphatase family metal-dependent hydrolase